ncbi:MAG: hypothetical protein KDJ52_13245 [Anaerolineae bacterium]|nr:hypothetical protein [Anaerolineae bacterium]
MTAILKYRLPLLLLFFVSSALLVKAQTEPQIQNLLVELWPEFDRPEVLIIYRVQLSDDTTLPTTVTFPLPGYIKTMNAVAYGQGNDLIAIDENDVEMTYRDDTLFLSFSTPSPLVQLEYYDGEIISRQDQTRTLDYVFTAPYAIENAIFQFQAPAQTEDFTLEPTASNTFVDPNGLTYNVINESNVAAGVSRPMTATYQRTTDTLTLDLITPAVSEHGEDVIPLTTEPPGDSTNTTIAYGLAGIGTLLILGAVGYWWWNRSRAVPGPVRRPAVSSRSRAKQSSSARTPSRQTESETAGFCYQCGTALRADANFCHKCGAERR